MAIIAKGYEKFWLKRRIYDEHEYDAYNVLIPKGKFCSAYRYVEVCEYFANFGITPIKAFLNSTDNGVVLEIALNDERISESIITQIGQKFDVKVGIDTIFVNDEPESKLFIYIAIKQILEEL